MSRECRAYIDKKELHVLYDMSAAGERSLDIHGECGRNLLCYAFLEAQTVQSAFRNLLSAYRGCYTAKDQIIDKVYGKLVEAVREDLNRNTYLAGYLLDTIQVLSAETLSDKAFELACHNIRDEKKRKLMRLYCIPECKELYIKNMPALIESEQKQLLAEVNLLWGNEAPWPEAEADQRLYIIANSQTYETCYIKSNLSYRSVLAPVHNYEAFQDGILCQELIKDMAGVFQMYQFNALDELMSFELMQAVLLESNVKRCENCGAWFVPEGRSDSIYCARIAPGETKPCHTIGALRKRAELVKDEPIYQLYTAAVKRMSKRKCRDGGLTAKQYRDWARNAEIMRERCLRGAIEYEAFEAWIDESSRLNRKRTSIDDIWED